MQPPRTLAVLSLVFLLPACGLYEAVRGGDSRNLGPPAAPKAPASQAVASRNGEARWVLIRNPRYGATMREPEYVWVEEDKIPTTLSTIIFGKNSVLAPAHVVTQYGSPPGGARISPLQYASAQPAGEATSPKPTLARAATKPEKAPVQEVTPRGYIVHIQKRLIVVDLTSADGVKPGSILSLRRERIRLTHPVSGEYLGELDEEIGTARVVELRERFTLAEIQETRPGVELKVKDRVVLKPE